MYKQNLDIFLEVFVGAANFNLIWKFSAERLSSEGLFKMSDNLSEKMDSIKYKH